MQQQERRLAREHPQFFVEDFRRYSDGMVKSPYARRAVDVGEMIKRGVIEKVQRPPELAPRNTRCFGTEFNTKQIWVLSGLAVLFALSTAGTCVLWFTDAFDNAVLTSLTLTNGSDAFRLWSEPPVRPAVRVHIFNYTNYEEYAKGEAAKLRVRDVGPYVYRETVKRVNIKFDDRDGTLSYQEHRDYKFVPEMSKGRQSDRLTVPNLPMLGAAAMSRHSYFLTRLSVSTLFTSLNARPFIQLPAHRFMWGYDDNLYELAKGVLALRNESPLDKFGIMANKIGTSRDVITINGGSKDIDQLGLIKRFNGADRLSHWSTDDCNTLTGSDGSLFPPRTVRERRSVAIYQRDMCRRLPMRFKRETTVLGGKIPAYRYSLPTDVFDRPETRPENQCYCDMDSGDCPPQGVFNSTPCAYGAPAFISFPHFAHGDPRLREAVDGLSTADPADEEGNYETYVDVHPTMGFSMGGKIRLQMNIQIRKSYGISQLDRFEDDMILPVAWVELGVDDGDLPDEMVDLIYQATFTVRGIRLALQYGCLLTMFATLLPVLLVVTLNKRCQVGRWCWRPKRLG